MTLSSNSSSHFIESLKEFASFIPLRLSPSERALLTVLESTLHVSEYTDNVDITSSRYGGVRGGNTKVKRILDGILEACHVATGLGVAGMLDHPSFVLETSSSCGIGSHTDTLKRKNVPRLVGVNGSEGNSNGKHRDYGSDHLSRKAAKQAAKARKKKEKQLRKMKNAKNNGTAIVENDDDETEDTLSVSAVEGITINSETPVVEDVKVGHQYESVSSIASLNPSKNEIFFQNICEIGRRNKVLNPSKMRGTYGKLMHLLQDAQSPSIAKSLGFSLYKDLVMVRPFLEGRGLGEILDDERLKWATMFVHTRDEGNGEPIERNIIEANVAKKKKYMEELLQNFADSGDQEDRNSQKISRQDLQRCIDSISDAIAVVESNIAPVRRMLQLLEQNFSPTKCNEKKFSLELRGSGNCYSSPSSKYGYGFGAFGSSFGSRESSGPTLSHSHSTQYTFVWQSLNLWQEVQRNMHQLWVCADDDLLSTTTTYQLQNTGQGLNRVQSCPRVGKLMRSLLTKTQRAADATWVGLSVIHLGDRDVPNALVFIDKYTQIPRFLKPIADFCDEISEMCADERCASYVEKQFGSQNDLKMAVLCDYFKHGFDGSGDDGGSCIDGRLTSSWNWTSRIVKKSYYHSFMLSGFQGFDGDFK